MLNIILDEEAFALHAIKTGEIATKPSITICILIKHYHKEGMTKSQIRDVIELFMSKNYKDFNSVKWQKKLDKEVNRFSQDKYTLKKVDNIKISENELQYIKRIDNIKLERLAFTLLVYCKIANTINPDNNNWVRKSSSELFKASKITERTIEQQLTLKKLSDLGAIEFAKTVDSESIQVNFVEEEFIPVIIISDMREFVLEYLKWKGDKIGKCIECNKLFKQTTNIKKYCKSCSKIIDRDKSKERMKKSRMFDVETALNPLQE